MRHLLIVLIVSAVAHSSKGDRVCEDENAEYVTCGSDCEPTCEYPFENPFCNPMCVIGCQCSQGFILHESKCIPKADCPLCGDPNAEYTFCGSQCPLTCQNPIDTGCVIDSCYEGCQCKEGYVLYNYTKCVLPQDCPLV